MLETIGAFTVGILALSLILLLLTISLNIVCGALGAIRFRRVLRTSSKLPAAWGWIAREGLRNWYGRRYDGDLGEYWVVGGLKVSHDIRDRLYRDDFYGA